MFLGKRLDERMTIQKLISQDTRVVPFKVCQNLLCKFFFHANAAAN